MFSLSQFICFFLFLSIAAQIPSEEKNGGSANGNFPAVFGDADKGPQWSGYRLPKSDRKWSVEGAQLWIRTTDGREIFHSGVVRGYNKPQDIELPLKGVKRLELIVEDAEEGNVGDFADWAMARLLR